MNVLHNQSPLANNQSSNNSRKKEGSSSSRPQVMWSFFLVAHLITCAEAAIGVKNHKNTTVNKKFTNDRIKNVKNMSSRVPLVGKNTVKTKKVSKKTAQRQRFATTTSTPLNEKKYSAYQSQKTFIGDVNPQALPSSKSKIFHGDELSAPSSTPLHASTKFAQTFVEGVKIEGNKRFEASMIEDRAKIHRGMIITPRDLQEALRRLMESRLFRTADVRLNGSIVTFIVVENPIIGRIAFEGASKVKPKILQENITLQERHAFSASQVQESVRKIEAVYKAHGYHQIKIVPKMIERDQHRVDVVFEITEGAPSYIQKILFVGNASIDDGELASEIKSRESAWYRFLSHDDVYDQERAEKDATIIAQYYKNRGFDDVQVQAPSCLMHQGSFCLVFYIREGVRYNIRHVALHINHDAFMLEKNKKKLAASLGTLGLEAALGQILAEIAFKKGDIFNAGRFEYMVEAMNRELARLGLGEYCIKPEMHKRTPNKTVKSAYVLGGATIPSADMDIRLVVDRKPANVLVRLDIEGNIITQDHVIRRESRLVEGSPVTPYDTASTKTRLENLDYFENVEIKVHDIDPENTSAIQRKRAVAHVKEKASTGQLMAQLAYNTADGVGANVQFHEANWRGTGNSIGAEIGGSASTKSANVFWQNPYAFGRPLSLTWSGFGSFSRAKHKEDSTIRIVRNSNLGTSIRGGYALSPFLFQGWTYRVQHDRVRSDAKVSPHVRRFDGNYLGSAISHDLVYDRRNSAVNPTQGYYMGVDNTFSGLGGRVRYLSNGLFGGYYIPLVNSHRVTLHQSTRVNAIVRLGKAIRPSDRFYLGDTNLLGFESTGIGPRDAVTGEALGGRYSFNYTATLSFPLGFSKEIPVKGLAYYHTGSVWNSGDRAADFSKNFIISRSFRLRHAIGAGVIWLSPLGRLGFTLTKVLTHHKNDERRALRIMVGTDL